MTVATAATAVLARLLPRRMGGSSRSGRSTHLGHPGCPGRSRVGQVANAHALHRQEGRLGAGEEGRDEHQDTEQHQTEHSYLVPHREPLSGPGPRRS